MQHGELSFPELGSGEDAAGFQAGVPMCGGLSLLCFCSLDSYRVLEVLLPGQLPTQPLQHAVAKDFKVTSSGWG